MYPASTLSVLTVMSTDTGPLGILLFAAIENGTPYIPKLRMVGTEGMDNGTEGKITLKWMRKLWRKATLQGVVVW